MYRDVLGLDEKRTVMKSYPSPFPKSNKLNLIVEGAPTRYSHRNFDEYKKIGEMVDKAHASKGKTAAFFPSYNVLSSVLPFIKTSPKFVQNERMPPRELHKLAKDFSSQGGMLIGVQGGSLSEGLDYSNGEIKTAVVVGIALEEMSLEVKSLIDYYQEKFGKGWEYAYIYPAVTRALQAAGRAIRKDEDKAAIIYLDERFNWQNYRKLFPTDERFVVVNQDEMERYLSAFWDGKSL
ncbi:ATP-dependent DNA helicase [uncultured archaeon]|nr:ATP-dependent DNA helicase [uncultured archaeon]